jgi:hypothetical protein
MVTAQVRPLPQVWSIALAGAGLVFAWVLLTPMLGWGSSGAHADDGQSGLLGGVADQTADAVASAVAVVAPVFFALAVAGGAGALTALVVGLCAPAGAFTSGAGSGPGAAALPPTSSHP